MDDEAIEHVYGRNLLPGSANIKRPIVPDTMVSVGRKKRGRGQGSWTMHDEK
jgi:hypothetical protein